MLTVQSTCETLHATFHLDRKRFYSIVTARSLVCPWKCLYRIRFVEQLTTFKNPFRMFEVKGAQGLYCYLQEQFSHSQGALGKYSSLQLTLKTIAQTTALRQKEVNYFMDVM